VTYIVTGTVDADHRSLPGHFPGEPLVPGVLILTRVLSAAASVFGCEAHIVSVAKFQAPLKPGESYAIRLDRGAERNVRFEVTRGPDAIARGSITLEDR
jgi:3-hydroxyacyl-[acyl-carrier-protein] dehydratase